MILVSLLLAAGVAVAVVLRSERAETAALSAEPQGAVVKPQEKGKFDPVSSNKAPSRTGTYFA